MLQKQASILSIILHPIFTPIVGIFVIFNSIRYFATLPAEFHRLIYQITAFFFTLLPLALMPVLRLANLISSYSMETKQERMAPFFLVSVCYFTGYYLASSIEIIPYTIVSFLLAITISSIFAGVVNFWWKISMHAIGWGGACWTYTQYDSDVQLIFTSGN